MELKNLQLKVKKVLTEILNKPEIPFVVHLYSLLWSSTRAHCSRPGIRLHALSIHVLWTNFIIKMFLIYVVK